MALFLDTVFLQYIATHLYSASYKKFYYIATHLYSAFCKNVLHNSFLQMPGIFTSTTTWDTLTRHFDKDNSLELWKEQLKSFM